MMPLFQCCLKAALSLMTELLLWLPSKSNNSHTFLSTHTLNRGPGKHVEDPIQIVTYVYNILDL